MLVAVAQGNKDATDALLKRGANIRVVDSSDKTVIFIAAEENRLDIMEVFILRSNVVFKFRFMSC